MQRLSSKPMSQRERQKRKRTREELLAMPILSVFAFSIAATAEYDNLLILFAVVIAFAVLILAEV